MQPSLLQRIMKMNHAIVRDLTLLTQWTLRPWSLAERKAGIRTAIKMAIIAITTNSSIKVNPVRNDSISMEYLLLVQISNGVKALFFICPLPFPFSLGFAVGDLVTVCCIV